MSLSQSLSEVRHLGTTEEVLPWLKCMAQLFKKVCRIYASKPCFLDLLGLLYRTTAKLKISGR